MSIILGHSVQEEPLMLVLEVYFDAFFLKYFHLNDILNA